jgi:transcriptional regulator with XRE-family HTH domain
MCSYVSRSSYARRTHIYVPRRGLSIPTPPEDSPASRLAGLLAASEQSQVVVAEAVGLTGPTLSRLAAGLIAITVETGQLLANHFGVRAGWLVYGEGDPHPDVKSAYLSGRRDALRQVEGTVRIMGALSVTPDASIADVFEQVAQAAKKEAAAKGGKRKKAGRKTA